MEHQKELTNRTNEIDQDTEVFRFRVMVGVEQVFGVAQDKEGHLSVHNFITEEQVYTGPDDIVLESLRFKRAVGHQKLWLVHQDITGEFQVREGMSVFAEH